ncbi:neuronal acetylcholine receptor subunit beta-3-like [Penaeus chinensis]|uniref:neuronal acetylcholine receptor subunit beta-3-like n=1 Tax=Penaeus chinensis TaxID=139456 RepID=UPI001FB5D087|nr:neuronal acetylcholine receptor subunit beta-3-like [Penaeus chinensis]
MLMLSVSVVFLSVLPICQGESSPTTQSTKKLSDEFLLVRHLFGKYNRHVRPVSHNREVTNVSLKIALFSILRLDTRDQTLYLNTEMIMEWHDHYLEWNPALYNGTSVIRVPYHEIWHPDVILYNTADQHYRRSIISTNAIVQNTGQVRLLSHAMFLSACDIDITWYPFDQQDCTLYLSSWTYDSSKIELFDGAADLSEYSENPELILKKFYSEKTSHKDPCCSLPFSTVVYHLQMQRRTLYSVVFFVLPGNIINICALLVFLLPPDSGEKVSLSMNCLIAMMVFLMAVTVSIPSSPNVPLIGQFYLACITIVALNLLMSVCILRCRFSNELKVHGKVRTLLRWLGRLLFIRIPQQLQDKWHIDQDKEELDRTTERMQNPPKILTVAGARPFRGHLSSEKVNQDESCQARITSLLESIYSLQLQEQCTWASKENDIRKEIEVLYVCQILDRIFFIVFLFVVIGFNVGLMTSSPYSKGVEYYSSGYSNYTDT